MTIYCGHCQKPFDQFHPQSLTECARKVGISDHLNEWPAKRYQVRKGLAFAVNPYGVYDTWTEACKGNYETDAKAQARARVLNSRQGA